MSTFTSHEKKIISLQFILFMIKNYLPDGRITENTNLLYFCHGTDQTGFFQDFFECRVGKNQFVQQ